MAGAQADRGGVSRVRPVFSARALAFADWLLGFAEREHVRLPEHRTFALPQASLRIGYSATEYAKLCDRVYLSPSCLSGDRGEVTLAVLDYETWPHAPRWLGSRPDFHEVTTTLAGHGLRGAYDPEHQTWDIYHPGRALGVRVMQAASARPPWEASFPLRLLLHWAGRSRDNVIVHAGTLGYVGRGVLLAGAGGAGKSGTTLAGILSGLSSVGDDYVAICANGGVVEARPVMRLVKQDIPGLKRLGLRAGEGALAAPPNWQGKIEFDFEALSPGARVDRLVMTAILIPHLSRSPLTAFRPASSREAMLAMAPSSLFQLFGSWREDFGFIASIARALPAFHLELSEDPSEIAAAIRAFMENGAR